MLERDCAINVVEGTSCSTSTADDATTLAAAHTSAGHPIQVSLRLAEPPAVSCVCVQIRDAVGKERPTVLAAHGDSLLIQVEYEGHRTTHHFVYSAGDAAAEPRRPPSLSLLPPYCEKTYFDVVPRELSGDATGLLRRGEDELVVAELRRSLGEDRQRVGVILMFRSCEWNRYYIKINEDWDLPSVPLDAVVPVDDRLLCWVDLCRGVVLVDVFKETPTVQYVRLPTAPHDCKRLNRNVCTTAGGGALKFVNIFGRCCCGAAASFDCEHSRHAYTIHTWTMRIGNGNMEWVKDGIVDATELWALDAYKGLPCDPLDRPIVSTDEPEVICFRMRDTKYGSRMIWQIMVNMRSKTIHSCSRHEEELGYRYTRDKLIPSNVSYFFNTLTGLIQMNRARPPAVVVDEQPLNRHDDSRNPTLQPSSFAEPASVQAFFDMFEALQEIPSYGLGPDEVKAYRILISSDNNGRRLTSLSRLPKDLRKDWLLMEIKASDAC